MITSVAISPHPLLLLRQYRGQVDVAEKLRNACLSAVGHATSKADTVVVVAGSPSPPVTSLEPLGLRVANELLATARWDGPVESISIGYETDSAECIRIGTSLAANVDHRPQRVALLVMADGSAKRSLTAPGHFDAQAAEFDARFTDAVKRGDSGALTELEPDLANHLWFQGRSALQVLAGATPATRPAVHVLYDDDPFGVKYMVAVWHFESSQAPRDKLQS